MAQNSTISIQGKNGYKMTYSFVQLLEYESFFGESADNVDIDVILAKLSRQQVVGFAMALANIYANKPLEKLSCMFASNHFRNRSIVVDKLKKLDNKQCLICSQRTPLEILRIAFSQTQCEDMVLTDTEESEMALFKVMLVINQRLMRYQLNDSTLSFDKLMFISANVNSLMYNFNEDYQKSRYLYQLEMSYGFFKMFSTSVKYKELYKAFLNKYNIDSWKKYVKTICFISLLIFSAKKSALIPKDLNIDIDKIADRNVLDRLILPYNVVVKYSVGTSIDRNANDDYRTFRSKPIIVMPDGNYFPISWEFVIDKLFNGLYFDLMKIQAANNIKNCDVEKLFTKVFCEEQMFSSLMMHSYNASMIEGITEDMCKARYKEKSGELGPPDYILKDRRSIILFECKDVRLPGNILETNDYDKIIEVYSNKLYKKKYQGAAEDKTKSRKVDYDRIGITQLTGHIKAIRECRFHWTTCKHNKNIYPVLIISDHKYLLPGFPKKVQDWYQESLIEIGAKNSNNRPLIVMSFITLIKYSHLFREHGFKYYFESYFRDCNASGIITFDDYMGCHRYHKAMLAQRIMKDIKA